MNYRYIWVGINRNGKYLSGEANTIIECENQTMYCCRYQILLRKSRKIVKEFYNKRY